MLVSDDLGLELEPRDTAEDQSRGADTDTPELVEAADETESECQLRQIVRRNNVKACLIEAYPSLASSAG